MKISRQSLLTHGQCGFTLIEVMVAVGVIAIAVPALLFAMMGQIDSSAHLRDKLQAQWVAENVMAGIRIQNRIDGSVPKTPTQGEEELGGRSWRWSTRSQAFSIEELSDVYGVEVSVWPKQADKDTDALVRYVGIIRNYELEAIVRPDPEKNTFTPANPGENSNQDQDTDIKDDLDEGLGPDDPIWDEVDE